MPGAGPAPADGPPRKLQPEVLLQRKRQAWEEHQITTHLPAKDVRVYDDDFAKREPCALLPGGP